MNIQIQATSLVFIILLIIFYKVQPKLGLYSEHLYFHMLILCAITLVFDVTSIIVIVHRGLVYFRLVELICKTYLICLILNGFYAFYYSLSDLPSESRKKARIVSITIITIIAIVVYLLPIDYYYDGESTYTLGPAVLSTYFFALFFILLTITFCIIKRGVINPVRAKAIIAWMGIWIIFALVQFLNNSFLIVGLGCAVGSVILFFFLENPDSNIDKNLGCFNSNALLQYLTVILDEKKPKNIIVLNFNNYEKKDVNNSTVFMRWLIEMANSSKNIRIFKNIHSEIWLIFDNSEDYNDYKEFIIKELSGMEKQIILVPDSEIFSSADELMKVIQYTEIEDKILLTRGIRNITIEDILDYNTENKIKNDIVDALEEDRIVIYIQPIFSTEAKRFVSGEVLVRMRTKDGVIVPPGVFIPVAERNGLIKMIGEVVFRKTCHFISNYKIRDYGIEYLEVNMAIAQAESDELVSLFTSIMNEYSIDPTMLNLEITETGSIRNRDRFMENLALIRSLGIELSLDDFGSGESNLDYIIQMPVSIVKFDKQMIDEFAISQKARFVVHHITNMAHEMGLKIVAEGIETSAQYREMKNIGIDYIQGYFFSKPIPAKEFLGIVSSDEDWYTIL